MRIKNARLVCKDCGESFRGVFDVKPEVSSVIGYITGTLIELCGVHHSEHWGGGETHSCFVVQTGGVIGEAEICSLGVGTLRITNPGLREKIARRSQRERE